jgi:hypothetical protein
MAAVAAGAVPMTSLEAQNAQAQGSPALAPTSDTISAVLNCPDSDSENDMDCSSESGSDDDVHSDDHGPQPMQLATRQQFLHSLPTAMVPGLNLGGITVAPAPQYTQSAKVECVAREAAKPLVPITGQRHMSDPGHCVSSRFVYRSMPTFRDFLSHTQSESGTCERHPPGCKIPGAPSPVPSASSLSAATPRGSMLTFRDLLPPHTASGGQAEPSRMAGAVATPPSCIPRPPILCSPPHRAPNPANSAQTLANIHSPVSLDPSESHTPSCIPRKHPSTSPSTGLFGSNEVDVDDKDDCVDPVSPCMSCSYVTHPSSALTPPSSAPLPGGSNISPVRPVLAPPGSILRSDGGILDDEDSQTVNSSMSPPSMTPPQVIVESRPIQPDAHTRELPCALSPFSAMRGDATHADAMEVDEQAYAHTCVKRGPFHRENKENIPLQSKIDILGGAADALDDDEGEAAPTTGARPLRWISAANVVGTHPYDLPDSDRPSEWRARHFGKITDSTYISDDLIRDEIAVTRRIASANVDGRPSHRQPFCAAAFDPSELRWLERRLRPTSAPSGHEAACLPPVIAPAQGSRHATLVEAQQGPTIASSHIATFWHPEPRRGSEGQCDAECFSAYVPVRLATSSSGS